MAKARKSKEAISKINSSNVHRSRASERKVAKWLTRWAKTPFRRRRVEGRETNVLTIEMAADVIPADPKVKFRFSVEVKIEKGFNLEALLANPRVALFTDWYHQATYDAGLASQALGRKVAPLLFFKPGINYNWVALPSKVYSELLSQEPSDSVRTVKLPCILFDAYAWLGPIKRDVSHSKKNKNLVELNLDPVVLCRWEDFAKHVDPKSAFEAEEGTTNGVQLRPSGGADASPASDVPSPSPDPGSPVPNPTPAS